MYYFTLGCLSMLAGASPSASVFAPSAVLNDGTKMPLVSLGGGYDKNQTEESIAEVGNQPHVCCTATHTRAHSITHVHTATLTHGATRACFDGMLKKACSILDMFMPHSGWWRVTAVVVLVCRLLIHLGTPAGDSHGQRHAAGEADSRPFA